MNYTSILNIQEVTKFYNLGDKIFETDFNFKTDRYLNNFQEHLFGLIRLRKYQTSIQKFFLRENEAVRHELVEFKVQCLKVICTFLLFNSIFRTTPEVSSKLYFVEIS